MIAQLGIYLQKEGFSHIPSNLPEFAVYYRIESVSVNIIQLIDYQKSMYLTADQCRYMQEKVRALFAERGMNEIHILQLVLAADAEKARILCEENSFCWVIDTAFRRLLIYEHQVSDFYGMRGRLEQWLANDTTKEATGEKASSKADKFNKRKWLELPVVTISLVLLNVLVFLICTFGGDLLYNKGALDVERVMEYGEYYRIVSAWFLHGSISHLFNNMLILYALGDIVEIRLGHLRFGLLYFLSGVGGSLCSLYYMFLANGVYVSIGASGAVFGVEGALLAFALLSQGKKKAGGRIRTITFNRLALVLCYSLYVGFRSTHVDNYAHIGGVITGFASGLLLYFTMRKAEDT